MARVHFFDSSQRCNYQRHNEQAAELDAHIPAFANRSSGVFTGCAVTTGPGLSINVAAGKALVNRALKSVSAGGISATNTAFSFIYISSTGTIGKATMSTLPSTFAVLAVAQASGGSIRALRDLRVRIGEYVLLSPGGSTAWRLAVITGGALSLVSL
jgi:hypothetical protein